MPRVALKTHQQFRDIRDYSAMRCPLHGFLSLLSGPWTIYILWLIHANGPMRFGQVKKQIPQISAKVLTERLRMLEEAGVLLRVQEATIPPKVTYSFTTRGQQLNEMLDTVNALAGTWVVEPKEPRIRRV
jgi:DNA-binding HxlR family transcriptional regulator